MAKYINVIALIWSHFAVQLKSNFNVQQTSLGLCFYITDHEVNIAANTRDIIKGGSFLNEITIMRNWKLVCKFVSQSVIYTGTHSVEYIRLKINWKIQRANLG